MSNSRSRRSGNQGVRFVDDNWDIRHKIKLANDGKMPLVPNFITSAVAGQSDWSEANLPDVLFYIIPPPSRYAGVPVLDLVEDGKNVIGYDGKPLKDLEVLPRKISLLVPGWLMEAWKRIDSRITYDDILHRMDITPFEDFPAFKRRDKNCLQNQCYRACRDILGAWVSHERNHHPYRCEVEALESLSSANFHQNTILSIAEQFPGRLVKKKLIMDEGGGHLKAVPEQVTVENLHQTTFPVDHFLLADDSKIRNMEKHVYAAATVLFLLQERAEKHNLRHWSSLERSCLPEAWFSRVNIAYEVNDTYDGGCSTCTQYFEGDRAVPSVKLASQNSKTAGPKHVRSTRRVTKGRPTQRKTTLRRPVYLPNDDRRVMRTVDTGVVTTASDVEEPTLRTQSKVSDETIAIRVTFLESDEEEDCEEAYSTDIEMDVDQEMPEHSWIKTVDLNKVSRCAAPVAPRPFVYPAAVFHLPQSSAEDRTDTLSGNAFAAGPSMTADSSRASHTARTRLLWDEFNNEESTAVLPPVVQPTTFTSWENRSAQPGYQPSQDLNVLASNEMVGYNNQLPTTLMSEPVLFRNEYPAEAHQFYYYSSPVQDTQQFGMIPDSALGQEFSVLDTVNAHEESTVLSMRDAGPVSHDEFVTQGDNDDNNTLSDETGQSNDLSGAQDATMSLLEALNGPWGEESTED